VPDKNIANLGSCNKGVNYDEYLAQFNNPTSTLAPSENPNTPSKGPSLFICSMTYSNVSS